MSKCAPELAAHNSILKMRYLIPRDAQSAIPLLVRRVDASFPDPLTLIKPFLTSEDMTPRALFPGIPEKLITSNVHVSVPGPSP